MTTPYTGLDQYLLAANQIYSTVPGKAPTRDQIINLAFDLQKQGMTGGLDATAYEQQRKLDTASAMVDEYENAFMTLTSPETSGIGARIAAPFKELGGTLGLNKVRAYKDLQLGLIAPLVRGLGDTGALSDADKIAAVKALPRISDSVEEARIKLNFIRAVINKGRRQSPTSYLASTL